MCQLAEDGKIFDFFARVEMHLLKTESRSGPFTLAPHMAGPSLTPLTVDFHTVHPVQLLIMASFPQAGRLRYEEEGHSYP